MKKPYRGKAFEDVSAAYYETLSPIDKLMFNMEYARRHAIPSVPLGGLGISDDRFDEDRLVEDTRD